MVNFNRYGFVVSPRFELGQAEPKTAVLPLHHETISLLFSKAVQRYTCFMFIPNFSTIYFAINRIDFTIKPISKLHITYNQDDIFRFETHPAKY